jgi:hypothetical protein
MYIMAVRYSTISAINLARKGKGWWYRVQGAYKRRKPTDMSSLKTLVQETAGRWGERRRMCKSPINSSPFYIGSL